MQIDRRQVHFEPISMPPHSSLAVRQFNLDHFPFLWHCHPEAELKYVVRGAGLRFVGNAIRTFEPGDLCLLGSFLPHSWQSSPDRGPVHSIVAQFEEDHWGHFLHLPEMRGVRALLKDTASKGIQIVGETAEIVGGLMKQLGREESGSIGQLLILIESLSRVAEHPEDHRLISSESTGQCVNDPGAAAIHQAIAILNDSIGDVLPSQSEIAHRLSMTPSTFSRVFRRCVGKNYMDYLNEWRIGLACRALLETNDSIIDISLTAGFENLSNFHRRFRDQTGMTPAQWRANARKIGGDLRHLVYTRGKAS